MEHTEFGHMWLNLLEKGKGYQQNNYIYLNKLYQEEHNSCNC